jgi:hypothetical protein
MIYLIKDLKNNLIVGKFDVKGILLPNLDREEMFTFCQKLIDKFQEELSFIHPLDIESFKKQIIKDIQKSNQRDKLYIILEHYLNVLLENDHLDDPNNKKELQRKIDHLNSFQKFLLNYLWRVETKYFGYFEVLNKN